MNNYKSNLEIIYSWPPSQTDLDSATNWNLKTYGYGYLETGSYVIFEGDDRDEGPERITIDLQQAYLDGEITEETKISCYADWFPSSSSGVAYLTWNYGGDSFTETIYPNKTKHSASPPLDSITLVKRISLRVIPELQKVDPVFNVNTGDLSIVSSGQSSHKYKDVKFSFGIKDRVLTELNSKSALLENPFVQSVDVDILNSSGIVVYSGYITDSFENSFVFTEQQNIDIFNGEYAKDFGIRVHTIGSNANIHTSEYYVFGNLLEMESVLVSDKSGVWENSFSSYQPFSVVESGVNGQSLTNNALYFSNYRGEVASYNARISGDVAFGLLAGESFLIDWGDSSSGLLFKQTGSSQYSGNVSVVKTNTEDALLLNLIAPTGINGNTYSFETGHLYTGSGLFNISLYCGISGSGYELVKQDKYKIPDEYLPQGRLLSGRSLLDKVGFNIGFHNDPSYVDFDKLEVYFSSGESGFLELETSKKVIPIFSKTKDYSFYLGLQDLTPDTPYRFKISPYGTLGSGHSWEVGPYSMGSAPKTRLVIIADDIISETISGVDIFGQTITSNNIITEALASDSLNINEFNVFNGADSSRSKLITGYIANTGLSIVIDSNPIWSGFSGFRSHEYFALCIDSSGNAQSSKLMTAGKHSLPRISEYAIEGDSQFINYTIESGAGALLLKAEAISGFLPIKYKLYKTSI